MQLDGQMPSDESLDDVMKPSLPSSTRLVLVSIYFVVYSWI